MRKLAQGLELRRLLSAIIALVFCLSAVLGILANTSSDRIDAVFRDGQTGIDVSPVRAFAFTPHVPIFINGNGGFTNASGVVSGSGEESDPYIIERWDINASAASGIDIRNASVHFVIRACYIHDGLSNLTFGIYLLNCTNGMVHTNTCSRNAEGIRLGQSSRSNNVVNNTCTNNRYVLGGVVRGAGIYVTSAKDNTIIDNVFGSGNGICIFLVASSGNKVVTNTCDRERGIFLDSSNNNTVTDNIGSLGLSSSSNNTISGNDIRGGWKRGMNLYVSNGNLIENNLINGGLEGLRLDASNGNTIRNNDLDGGLPLWLERSSGNTISDNHCISDYSSVGIVLSVSSENNNLDGNVLTLTTDGVGILVMDSDNTSIINNNCSYNGYIGVYLSNSSDNVLISNTMCFNSYYGMYIEMGSRNLISNNTFIGNNGATGTYNASHIQAFDTGTGNWWNGTDERGNYWSDWTKPDSDMNGIVDVPYSLDGSAAAKDFYPLTNPVTKPIYTMVLGRGWNVISLPLVEHGYLASTLGLNPGDMVSRWNSTTRSYQTHIVGIPVNDFPVNPNTGYWINVPNGTRTLTLYGSLPTITQSRTITVPRGGGWELIGFTGFNTTRHASDIPAMYSSPGSITIVSYWNTSKKAYTNWLSIIPTVNDFVLVPGQGYEIFCTASGLLSYEP